MALTAVLEFGDNSIGRFFKHYLISDCRFIFKRPYNDFCPRENPRCERLEVVVVAPGKNDLSLFQWYSGEGVQSGRIVINMSADGKNENTDTRIISFEDAHCFSLSENYDIDTQRRRLLKLGIISERITIDEVVFYNFNL